MNPKFRDLQIQAFSECKTFEDGQFQTDEVFERFAELIVRECAGLVNEQLQHNNPNDSLLALKIKEHFGVIE